MFADEERKAPTVLGVRTLSLALGLHVLFFVVAYLFAVAVRKPKETVIPIDMTVVVHENLDGNENEPPPMKPPEPPPPQPKPEPKPVPQPEPPPVVEPKVDAVVKIPDKPKPPNKSKEIKKPKPTEKPKKTKEQLLKEKLERIRNAGKIVNRPVQKPVQRQPNGRTGKKTLSEAELQKFLSQGARPGVVEQLPNSEYQRCVSLIQAAFYSKWDRPPWTDTLKEMHLSVQLGGNGRILGYKLVKGSGDPKADATVLQAASLVKSIVGLSPDFIKQNKTVLIRFKVTPQ